MSDIAEQWERLETRAFHNEPVRVRIRVGKKSGFGLLGAVHDIVSRERL